jgi:hypothetical protein
MAMQDSNNEDTLRLHKVDEPVCPQDELAVSTELRVGQPVTAIRKEREGLCGIDRKLGEVGRVGRRVLCYELDCRFQVLDGWISPDYLASHLARRFFTCSWL